MDVKKLVVEISPLYNAYKKNDSIAGWEAICLMWKTGEILAGFINKHDVAPNKLYREVYGGGEGSTNIAKKGYISRHTKWTRGSNIRRDKEKNERSWMLL